MKQQSNRMIAEVNKLIGNTLIKSGGIYLPEVGSLSVVTLPPAIGEAAAPVRKVEMTSEQQHRSIVEIICERGSCTPSQAAQIYQKWVEMVSMLNSKLLIKDVGEISDGCFTATAAFEERLNPVVLKIAEVKEPAAESEPVKKVVKVDMVDDSVEQKSEGIREWEEKRAAEAEKSKSPKAKRERETQGGGAKKAIIGFVAVAALVALVVVLSKSQQSNTPVEEVVVQQEEVVAQEVTQEVVQEEVQTAQETPQVKPAAAPKAPKAPQTPQTPEELLEERFNAGREQLDHKYKVVFGAFSTANNVARAIAIAEKRTNGEVSCTVYNHGNCYLVSLYNTKSKEEAIEFVERYRDVVKEPLWIHVR